MATVSLQNIMINFPELRHEVLKGMSIFILREIPDSCPLVLESALKTLGQFIPFWRNLLTPPATNETVKVADESLLIALSWVEACALVTFCSYRSVARKLSLAIMKEVRLLTSMLHVSRVSHYFPTHSFALIFPSSVNLLNPPFAFHFLLVLYYQGEEDSVLDVIEEVTPDILKCYLALLTPRERVRSSPLHTHTVCASSVHCILSYWSSQPV